MRRYWHSARPLPPCVELIVYALQNIALELGYNDTAPANELLQDRAVISITIGNDLSTVLAAQARNNSGPIKDSGISSDLMGGHCSGFVRVTPNNQDGGLRAAYVCA